MASSLRAKHYGGTQDRMFWSTAFENRLNNDLYLARLVELSASMFDWTGLPETCDVRTLELALLANGRAVFFKDDALDMYMTLPVNVSTSGYDVYGQPLQFTARSMYNNYRYPLTQETGVMIYNNYLRTPSIMQLVSFADRLGKIDEIIDININAQKTPILILADESKRLTMKNLYMKYDGNQPFIFGDKNLSINDFTVLKTDAPYVADKLYEIKTQIFNEALTYLGISNTSLQKKERLITDEVSRNMGGTIAARYNRLNERQKACEKINSLFNLNVWCEYKEDYDDHLILEDADDVMYQKQTEEQERKEENNE